MAWTDCEYCFLRGYEVYQAPTMTYGQDTITTCSGWHLEVLITCDLLDVDRYNLAEWPTVAHVVTISGSQSEERHTQDEIFAMSDQIMTTVSGHMDWAKEYYAEYIMI